MIARFDIDQTTFRFRAAIVMAALLVPNLPAHAAPPPPIDVFVSGTEGYHTFRIPVLLPSARGTLLAFCEGRKEGQRDHGTIHLVLKRSTDGGVSWSPVRVVVAGEPGATYGNPGPVVDRETGRVWLVYNRNNNSVYVTSSDDDGLTWTPPRNLTRDVRLPHWEWYAIGPSPGIQLQRGRKGRLVVPANHTERVGEVLAGRSHAIYSDDHGATWRLGHSVPLSEATAGLEAEFDRVNQHARRTALGTEQALPLQPDKVPPNGNRAARFIFAGNENAIVELADGRLLMNSRGGARVKSGEKAVSMRALSVSRDSGVTWSRLQHHPELVEPVCHAAMIASGRPGGTGQVLVFSNPAHPYMQEEPVGRLRMTVRVSLDEGKTWPYSRLLHSGPSAYSTLVMLKDGTILCLFEGGEKHRREWIRLMRVPLNVLVAP